MSATVVHSALYPGSFDPLHNGHLELIEAAARLFDGVIVGHAQPPEGTSLFSQDERLAMIEESLATSRRPVATAGPGRRRRPSAGADVLMKGLRSVTDFDVEMTMAHTNLAVSGVPTIFLPTAARLGFIVVPLRSGDREGGEGCEAWSQPRSLGA